MYYTSELNQTHVKNTTAIGAPITCNTVAALELWEGEGERGSDVSEDCARICSTKIHVLRRGTSKFQQNRHKLIKK